VNELILAYLKRGKNYYRKDGKATSELRNIGIAMRHLRSHYGRNLCADFGPLALKTVREALVKSGICRNEVNKRVRHIVRAFKWGVGEEIVTPGIVQALQAVPGLKRGRTEARESEPVKPVPDASVEAVRPFVSAQVWAMVQLQQLTGMRPGEVCVMRSCDIDTNGRTWMYTPESHKTEHLGKQRRVYLGPRAQAILRPWLKPELRAYLFSPTDAAAEQKARKRQNRKTRVQPSQRDRSKRNPKRTPGEFYDTDAYRRAIARACTKAEVPSWHPHQLRHNAATNLRREYGLDVARAVLGHSSTSVTEIYAELDATKAADVMACVG
jgi:integrase